MTSIRFKSVLLAVALVLFCFCGKSAGAKSKNRCPRERGFVFGTPGSPEQGHAGRYRSKKTGRHHCPYCAPRDRSPITRPSALADIEAGKKMQTDHLFRLYSMTKPVTSVALLTLFEEGRFQLNDPPGEILPAFKNVKVFVNIDEKGRNDSGRAQTEDHHSGRIPSHRRFLLWIRRHTR